MMNTGRRVALQRIGLLAAALAGGASRPAPGQPMPEKFTMLTRPIPSSREAIPVIGLGTWQTFDVGVGAADRAPLEGVLSAFFSMGGKVIDSSPMYGSSEEVVGDLLANAGLRQKCFIATKVWTSGEAAGIRQMQESMRKLQASTIDLMQVHNLLDAHTHLDTLAEWKRAGRVRYIGVTHYTTAGQNEVAKLIASRPVDFIQINYSVAERDAERRLLPLAAERGVAVIANRPFAGGELFRSLRGKPVPGWGAEIGCNSWAQLMLKYVISHPAITCAIPASAKAEHTRDNMAAGHGPLPDEKMRARIAAAIS
jgi:diketogulonate reductase-like aldo/keto reductase